MTNKLNIISIDQGLFVLFNLRPP